MRFFFLFCLILGIFLCPIYILFVWVYHSSWYTISFFLEFSLHNLYDSIQKIIFLTSPKGILLKVGLRIVVSLSFGLKTWNKWEVYFSETNFKHKKFYVYLLQLWKFSMNFISFWVSFLNSFLNSYSRMPIPIFFQLSVHYWVKNKSLWKVETIMKVSKSH